MMQRILLAVSILLLGCGGEDTGTESGIPGLSNPGGAEGTATTGDIVSNTGEIDGPVFAGGTWSAGECGEALFLDVGAYAGPGGSYPMPELTVTCTETTRQVASNGIPHYTYLDMTPNGLEAQNFNWEVPLNPEEAANSSQIPCLGTVGYSINGIPLYGPNEGPFPDPYGDPIANDVMDWCLGHTGGSADYHYHGIDEECMAISETEGPSPVLGFALDGFPIYGPRGCLDEDCSEVVSFVSSWEPLNPTEEGCSSDTVCGADQVCAEAVVNGVKTTACLAKDYAWDNHQFVTQDGPQYLDECNGRVGPDGTYRYHATSTFPYILGCFKGTATDAGGPMGSSECPSQ